MRLIDADALKKTLCEEYEAREHYIGEIMLKAIDNAPTVIWCNQTSEGLPLMDMRVKNQGEWMVTAEDNDGIHRIECPFCRYEKGSNFADYIMVTFEKLPHFCENCGADMRGDTTERRC